MTKPKVAMGQTEMPVDSALPLEGKASAYERAMGADDPDTLAAIFGTAPSPNPPRHGDDLDA